MLEILYKTSVEFNENEVNYFSTEYARFVCEIGKAAIDSGSQLIDETVTEWAVFDTKEKAENWLKALDSFMQHR